MGSVGLLFVFDDVEVAGFGGLALLIVVHCGLCAPRRPAAHLATVPAGEDFRNREKQGCEVQRPAWVVLLKLGSLRGSDGLWQVQKRPDSPRGTRVVERYLVIVKPSETGAER